MTTLRRLVAAALCAGLLAGVVAAASHLVATVPLILKAEVYEEAAQQAHPGSHETVAEWVPEGAVERAVYTVAADLLAAIGFALLLAAAFAFRDGAPDWRQGLLWGLAGFATFTLAPGVGLPPELPGAEAGPLVARQLWWLATVALTGSALALFAFARRPILLALGAVLLILPHLVGAPAETGAGAAPAALAHQFAVAAMLTSLLFWLALGAATTYFYRRFAPPAA